MEREENPVPKPKGRAMTVVELRKYFDERMAQLEKQCDSCQHECDCPDRIKELDKSTDARMDVLDENDEKLRQNINKAYNELNEKLEQEHRLRVISEEKVARLELESKGHGEMMMKAAEAYSDMEEENKKFASQNLKLGVLAGVCLGLCLCVLAVFIAG